MGMKQGSISFELRTKRQSMECHHLTSPGKKFKAAQEKAWPTFFWDAEGGILVDITPQGQVINSGLYIQTLKTSQKHFRRVRPHKDAAEILLQCDNAQSHTSFKRLEAITELGWTVFPHPPYSPDLAPSDLSLFGVLKDATFGRFGSEDKVI